MDADGTARLEDNGVDGAIPGGPGVPGVTGIPEGTGKDGLEGIHKVVRPILGDEDTDIVELEQGNGTD